MEASEMNYEVQDWDGIKLKLRIRDDYTESKAKSYVVINENIRPCTMRMKTFWIPNEYLEEDGTIKPGADIGFVFGNAAENKLRRVGINPKKYKTKHTKKYYL